MRERLSRATRDLWLPLLVGLVGVLTSLAIWGGLVQERRDRLLESTRDTAAETASAVELRLEQQLERMQALTDLWARFGVRELPTGPERPSFAGLASLAWVDLDEPSQRVTAGEGDDADAALDELVARPLRAPLAVGPQRDGEASGYRLFLPTRTLEDHEAILAARFRIEPLLESTLRARAPGYAIVVAWNGREIFSRGAPSEDAWHAWWHVEQAIPLPFGGRWELSLHPTSQLAAARLTAVPHYLLAAGLLLSGILALAVHQVRVISRQSRFLTEANYSLERRGQELGDEVAARTAELRDAIAELESFNYSVSHDLRSPIGAILNFAAILEEDYQDRPLDAEGRKLLARIHRSGARAIALLEGLLQLSRAGRAAIANERVEMGELAREVFTQLRAVEPDPDVEIRIDPLPDAVGDRALLGNVLANLLENALKYSRGTEKRRVRVSGWQDGDEVVYEVSDNGRGFDMRYADKLFGVFERLHSDEEIEGTGVGLAMVARIVKRHGGRVSAQGRPGEGARFTFTLPAPEVA